MEDYKLSTAPAPHFHDRSSTPRIMLDVIIALLPSALAAVIIFGTKALLLIVTCVLSALVFESLFCLITRRKNTIGDLSAVVTGLLLALNLGTEVRIYEAVVGTAVAVLVAKCLFGGLGRNWANPAITGRVFMLETFSSVTSFTNPVGVELVSTATPLVLLSGGNTSALPSWTQMLLGLHGGTIGETCIAAIVIGWIYLSIRGVIKWYVPLSYILTVFVLYLVSSLSLEKALYEILAGGLFLGAVFMATDYVTTPITTKGKVVFCICAGILTFVIREFMALPEGVSFSILIMNIFTPLIEKCTHTVALGGTNYVK